MITKKMISKSSFHGGYDNYLKTFKDIVGEDIFKKVINQKLILTIWSRTTPSNWWFHTPTNFHNYKWHSDEGENRRIFDLRLFTKINEGEYIDKYGFPDRSGTPESIDYIFNRDLYES